MAKRLQDQLDEAIESGDKAKIKELFARLNAKASPKPKATKTPVEQGKRPVKKGGPKIPPATTRKSRKASKVETQVQETTDHPGPRIAKQQDEFYQPIKPIVGKRIEGRQVYENEIKSVNKYKDTGQDAPPTKSNVVKMIDDAFESVMSRPPVRTISLRCRTCNSFHEVLETSVFTADYGKEGGRSQYVCDECSTGGGY